MTTTAIPTVTEEDSPADPAIVRVTGGAGRAITAYRWEPERPPRAIVQLTHAASEQRRRYDRLAAALTGHGFVVQGYDNSGHRATAVRSAPHGVAGATGWPGPVDEIGRLLDAGRAAHPGLPVILLAHGAGSLAAQRWVLDHSRQIDGLVLSDTAILDPLEPGHGCPGHAVAPAAPCEQWTRLSRHLSAETHVAEAIRRDLPVLITVSGADPVHGGLAPLHAVVDRLTAAGLSDVSVRIWPRARHHALDEINRDKGVEDLLKWLDRIVA